MNRCNSSVRFLTLRVPDFHYVLDVWDPEEEDEKEEEETGEDRGWFRLAPATGLYRRPVN